MVSPDPSGMRGRFEVGWLGGNEKPEQEQNSRARIAKKEVATDVSTLLMNYDSLSKSLWMQRDGDRNQSSSSPTREKASGSSPEAFLLKLMVPMAGLEPARPFRVNGF